MASAGSTQSARILVGAGVWILAGVVTADEHLQDTPEPAATTQPGTGPRISETDPESVPDLRAELARALAEVATLKAKNRELEERNTELLRKVEMLSVQLTGEEPPFAPLPENEEETVEGAVESAKPPPAQAGSEAASELLDRGRVSLEQENLHQAKKQLKEFLQLYGEDKRAGEAHYWLAEVLYGQGEFSQAIAEYAKVLEYPDQKYHPAARLKTGYSWYELGNLEKAKSVLTEVQDEIPGSHIARLAQLRLERIQRDSHDP